MPENSDHPWRATCYFKVYRERIDKQDGPYGCDKGRHLGSCEQHQAIVNSLSFSFALLFYLFSPLWSVMSRTDIIPNSCWTFHDYYTT